MSLAIEYRALSFPYAWAFLNVSSERCDSSSFGGLVREKHLICRRLTHSALTHGNRTTRRNLQEPYLEEGHSTGAEEDKALIVESRVVGKRCQPRYQASDDRYGGLYYARHAGDTLTTTLNKPLHP